MGCLNAFGCGVFPCGWVHADFDQTAHRLLRPPKGARRCCATAEEWKTGRCQRSVVSTIHRCTLSEHGTAIVTTPNARSLDNRAWQFRGRHTHARANNDLAAFARALPHPTPRWPRRHTRAHARHARSPLDASRWANRLPFVEHLREWDFRQDLPHRSTLCPRFRTIHGAGEDGKRKEESRGRGQIREAGRNARASRQAMGAGARREWADRGEGEGKPV